MSAVKDMATQFLRGEEDWKILVLAKGRPRCGRKAGKLFEHPSSSGGRDCGYLLAFAVNLPIQSGLSDQPCPYSSIKGSGEISDD